MQLIDLSKHLRDPKYYNRDRDIETALAWNAIKKTLTEVGREDLFAYIKSVKITEKSVVITTGKPIVNSELRFYKERFLERLCDDSSSLSLSPVQTLRVR